MPGETRRIGASIAGEAVVVFRRVYVIINLCRARLRCGVRSDLGHDDCVGLEL